jgi:hypothetical protein
MKTNKIILISLAGFFIVLLIVSLVVMRQSIQSLHDKQLRTNKFIPVESGNFEKLEFSSNWDVKIIASDVCTVELSVRNDSLLKPEIKNIKGTLFFTMDTILAKSKGEYLKARVAMPFLQYIKARGKTKIHLVSFSCDSLQVVLENGCEFTGSSNTLKKATYKISGDALLNTTNPL